MESVNMSNNHHSQLISNEQHHHHSSSMIPHNASAWPTCGDGSAFKSFDQQYLHQLYQQQGQRERENQGASLYDPINQKTLNQDRYLQYLMGAEEEMNAFEHSTPSSSSSSSSSNANSFGNPYFPSICPPSPPHLIHHNTSSTPNQQVTQHIVQPQMQPHPMARQRSLSSPINFTAQGMAIRSNTPDGYRYSGPSPAPMAMPGSPDPSAHPHYNHYLPSIANLVNGRRSVSPLPVQFTVVPTFVPQAVFSHNVPPQQPQFQNIVSPSLLQCLQTNQQPAAVVFDTNPNDLFLNTNHESLFSSTDIPAPTMTQVPISRPVAFRPNQHNAALNGVSISQSSVPAPNNNTVEGKIEEILFLDKLQPRMNRRWGKLLRQSLKTEPSGKFSFSDTIKKKNFFNFNFNGKGESIQGEDGIIRKMFNNLEEVETLFASGDKPVCTKSYSMEYGRKVVHSRIQLPLIISFNPDSKVVTFEGQYKSYVQEKIHPKRLAKEENERIRNYNLSVARASMNSPLEEEYNQSDEKIEIKKRKVES